MLVLMLTSSLYFFSALSKCNLMFLEQHGQVILAGLFKSLGLDLGRIPENLRRLLIAGFPLGEMLIAVGLLFDQWRRLASMAALLMHSLLIVTFSPLGCESRMGRIDLERFLPAAGVNALDFFYAYRSAE